MKVLRNQSDKYLKGLDERIRKDFPILDTEKQGVIAKIDYILHCREDGIIPLPCQGTCDGSCGPECKNNL